MRSFLPFALFSILACQAPVVLAGTLYKCVDAAGKITFSDQECEGKSKTEKTIVTKAEDPAATKIRAEEASQKWKKADAAFQQRRSDRQEKETAEQREANSRSWNNKISESTWKAERQRRAEAEARQQGIRNNNCGTQYNPCR
jgi:Mg-chelatase subunit ChlI